MISFSKAAPAPWGKVEFCYRMPKTHRPDAPILVLVPGYNGSGPKMLPGWSRFADANGMVLMAPTFRTSPEELKAGAGYYYPDQWSGRVLEEAVGEVERREGLKPGRILLFGVSAGAHFVHGFAQWRPQRVRAFVAAAAAWWGEPSRAMTGIPALIMCGEDDPRITPTLEYFYRGFALGLGWLWRSYPDTGHTTSPMMLATAEAFLADCVRSGSPGAACYGDIQTYAVTATADKIPEAVRVKLPSRAFAEIWKKDR